MPKPSQFPAGLIPVSEHLERNSGKIFLNIRARGKCGKTDFACKSPRPLVYFNVDQSLRGVADKYKNDREFAVHTVEYDPLDQSNCMDAWHKFQDLLDASFDSPYVRSIVVDTQDELLKMQRAGYFGDRRANQFEYATPNGDFLNTFKQYHRFDKNLIVTTKMDKEYVPVTTVNRRTGKESTQSEFTGRYVAQGKMEMEENLPECCVELYRFKNELGALDFGLTIDKLRVGLGPQVEGPEHSIEGAANVSFQGLMMTIFPDSDPRDWK